MNNLIEHNGFWFSPDTPKAVMNVICNNYNNRETRLRFWYGDQQTGKSWNDENDVCGYIGRSTGSQKIPLLIQKRNSTGGGAILCSSIIKIVDIRVHKILYQHPTFNQPLFIQENNQVFKGDNNLYATCKNEKSAKRLCDFMNGNRHNK